MISLIERIFQKIYGFFALLDTSWFWGVGIGCLFYTPAGIAIQQDADNDPDGLKIRIGAAYGMAILRNGDVFGEVVNNAAAVAKVAQAHQFLISEAFADSLEGDDNIIVHPFNKIKMKGSQQVSVIHRVDWEPQDITVNATQVLDIRALKYSMAAPQIDLQIQCRGKTVKEVSVTPKTTPFSVGRELKTCSLAVPTSFASCEHFHILHWRGKFILKDQSSNGTYVKENSAEVIYLRREEMPLRGSGNISLGQESEEADLIVYFKCAAA